MKSTGQEARGRSHGIIMVRLVKVLVLAVMLFGIAGLGSVSARTFKNGSVSVTQHEYVGICKDQGGTPSRAGPRQVKCDMGGGYSSTCNFKTNKCEDTIPMVVPQGDQSPVIDNADSLVVEQGSESSQPEIIQPVDTGAVVPLRGHDASALDPLAP